MSATQDLIAAALRLTALAERNTDDRDEWQHSISEVRELCARAMVQQAPDMAEVERLVGKHAEASALLQLCRVTDLSIADRRYKFVLSRTALLDYVRGIMAERDALIADNERLSGLYEQAVKGRADMRRALRDARAAAPQPVSAAEVPMPIPTEYQGAKVGTEWGGEAYSAGYFDGEAAGYARGLAEGRERCAVEAWMYYMDTCKRNGIGPDVYPQWCCAAALRGEVKP